MSTPLGMRFSPCRKCQSAITEVLPLYVGRLPVHCAAAGGSEGVLRYLLDRGGDPGVPDFRRSMPLHDAAELGVFLNFRVGRG